MEDAVDGAKCATAVGTVGCSVGGITFSMFAAVIQI